MVQEPGRTPPIPWLSEQEQRRYEGELSAATNPASVAKVQEAWREVEIERRHDASWNWSKREHYKFDKGYETNDSLMKDQEPRRSVFADEIEKAKREVEADQGRGLSQDGHEHERDPHLGSREYRPQRTRYVADPYERD